MKKQSVLLNINHETGKFLILLYNHSGRDMIIKYLKTPIILENLKIAMETNTRKTPTSIGKSVTSKEI